MACYNSRRSKAFLLAASILGSTFAFRSFLSAQDPLPFPDQPIPEPEIPAVRPNYDFPLTWYPNTPPPSGPPPPPPPPEDAQPAWHSITSKLSLWASWNSNGKENEDYYGSTLESSAGILEGADRIRPEHDGSRCIVGKASLLIGPKHQARERALRTHTLHNALYGYPHYVLHRSIISEDWTQPAHMLSLLLQELAKPAAERLEWLYYFAPDAIILNPNIPLELFLPPADGTWDSVHLLHAQPAGPADDGPDTSVFAVRVHPWAVNLFSAVLAARAEDSNTDSDTDAANATTMMRALLRTPRFRAAALAVPRDWFNAAPADDGAEDSDEDILRNGHGADSTPETMRHGVFVVHDPSSSTSGTGGSVDHSAQQRTQYWLTRAEQHLPAWEVPVGMTGYPEAVGEFWAQARAGREAEERDVEALREEGRGFVRVVQGELIAVWDRLGAGEREDALGALEGARKVVGEGMAPGAEVVRAVMEELRQASREFRASAETSREELTALAYKAITSAEYLLDQVFASGPASSTVKASAEQLKENVNQLQDLVSRADWKAKRLKELVELAEKKELEVKGIIGVEAEQRGRYRTAGRDGALGDGVGKEE